MPVSSFGQEQADFPWDPYKILKSWNYDKLVRLKGEGTQIIDTLSGQAFIAGLSYTDRCFEKTGTLAFYFNNEDISRMEFRFSHPARPVDQAFAERIMLDTAVRNAYEREVMRNDSLRRDTLVQDVSKILGLPITSGPTSPSDKLVRYSATWINRGFSCVFKDDVEYGNLVFSLSMASAWVSGEYDIDATTEIVQRAISQTRKTSWTTSLLAQPADTGKTVYQRLILVLDYRSGERYVENLPDLEYSYLPSLQFDDTDGTATLDAWITAPVNSGGTVTRQFIYSLQFKEPILIFNTNDFLPDEIRFVSGKQIEIRMADGTLHRIDVTGESPAAKAYGSGGVPIRDITIRPAGYSQFKPTARNRDGSMNFIGTISLIDEYTKEDFGGIEILYQYVTGGWDVKEILLSPAKM
ncbi:MAG TPA: hypothetical protein DC042_06925 [Bacteroidales bacterium]|nr:hypothetical protein [Bacteroidales bacterium]